ncbi:MAG: hypothetical protein QM710_03400 [Flavobacterium sp.]
MLEEKNDNLQEADGNAANEAQEVTIAENQEIPVENPRGKRSRSNRGSYCGRST